MHGLLSDVVHALRIYGNTPVSSFTAVAALALALAVLTAFLALWSEFALKPPPGIEPAGRITTVLQTDGERQSWISGVLLERISEEVASIEAIAGVFPIRQHAEREGALEQIWTEVVTERFFPELRPRLALGRALAAEDHQAHAAPVVLLSYRFWQQQYGGRPDVLGETLRIHGPRQSQQEVQLIERWQDYRIVGVLAPEMEGTASARASVWMPLEQWLAAVPANADTYRETMNLLGLARPAAGTSAADVSAELQGRFTADAGLSPYYGRLEAVPGIVPSLIPYRETMRQLHLYLAGGLMLALVAACNIGLFLLSRAPGRRRELAIRMAVGAPLRRVSRQLLTEAALLVTAATAVGILASAWLAVLLRDRLFRFPELLRDINPFDWPVLLLMASFALLLAMLISLAPIVALRGGIAAAGRSHTARASWSQRTVGAVQIATAAVVSAAALSLVWYLNDIRSMDPGFRAPGVHFVTIRPPDQAVDANLTWQTIRQEREHRREVIGGLPGIERVGFGTSVPGQPGVTFRLPVTPPHDPDGAFMLDVHTVDPAYMALMGISVRHGRRLEHDDGYHIVVNEALAQRVWDTTDVVGERLPSSFTGWEIVGVVRDVHYAHPAEPPPPMAFAHLSGAAPMEGILVETTASSAELRTMLEQKIAEGELAVSIDAVAPVETLWERQLAVDQTRTALSVGTAFIVVALAAFGFYGTQHFVVAAGRREYAIRAAVGASPRAIRRLVLGEALHLALPGLVVGGLLAFITVAWIRDGFLSAAVSPAAVAALSVVVLIVLLLAASVMPAREASRMEPAVLEHG